MELVLEPDSGEGAAAAAARAAAARAGLSFAPGHRAPPDPWWRAGVVDAIDREPSWPTPPRQAAYEAARSPRSTRGATRA